MAKLVIVESPAKAKTIGKYLGKDYEVTASMGHIRDLPASQLGIDIEHDYAPQYISINHIGRGCTILDGVGGYSKRPVKVVVLLAKKSESNAIFRLVKGIDHQAFISQSIVRGVYGEGFDQIKVKVKKEKEKQQ